MSKLKDEVTLIMRYTNELWKNFPLDLLGYLTEPEGEIGGEWSFNTRTEKKKEPVIKGNINTTEIEYPWDTSDWEYWGD